jgi:hypothetical protein
MGKNYKSHFHPPQNKQTPPPQRQEPQQGSGGGGGSPEPGQRVVGPLEAALQDTRERATFIREKTEDGLPVYPTSLQEEARQEARLHGISDDHMGQALEMVDAKFHGQGVFHTDREMIEYLEKKGYQVIEPVQVSDGQTPVSFAELQLKPRNILTVFDTNELSAKFEVLKFEEPDKFRAAHPLSNGNIMVMVEIPEGYAEGVLSEAGNQEVTPGQFLDQRLQESLENYFQYATTKG